MGKRKRKKTDILMGNRLRDLRNLRGMSQEALARATGYKGAQGIQSIEAGKTGIPAWRLDALCRALGVDRSALVGDESAGSKTDIGGWVPPDILDRLQRFEVSPRFWDGLRLLLDAIEEDLSKKKTPRHQGKQLLLVKVDDPPVVIPRYPVRKNGMKKATEE